MPSLFATTDATTADRWQSLKAGAIAAIAGGIAWLVTMALHHWLAQSTSLLATPATPSATPAIHLVGVAIASISTALFGITYRYIIRTEHNSHLKSGAVTAFTTVRGLSHADDAFVTWPPTSDSLSPVAIALFDAALLFSCAAIALEIALHYRWLLPMGNGDINELK